jgi:rubrerythrin
MSEKGTVAELFALAIQAEEVAEQLYLDLATRFRAYPPVAQFWRRYAAEETGHAHWLRRLSTRIDAEQIAAAAEPQILANAHRSLNRNIEAALADLGDLEEAYQLAHELEHSETNVVFEFLITHFAADAETGAFLRNQLREHVTKLSHEFPEGFRDPAARQAIRPAGEPDPS